MHILICMSSANETVVTVAEMTADEARAYVEWYNSAPRRWFDVAGDRLWKAYDIIRIEREAHEAAAKARPKTYTERRFAEFVAKKRGLPAPRF